MTTKFNKDNLETFTYSKSDLHQKSLPWSKNSTNFSPFDQKLKKIWDQKLLLDKAFSYKFTRDVCDYKEIKTPEGFGAPFICQLNQYRGLKKRTRPDFEKIDEDFCEKGFQFKKIHEDEILFKFRFEDQNDIATDNARKTSENSENYIIVNAAPIEQGHVLLISELELGHKQVMNEKTLRNSLDLILLSNQPSFRVMYNTIWAWASINHLHTHGFYMDHMAAGDVMPVKSDAAWVDQSGSGLKVSRTIDENVALPAFCWDNLSQNCQTQNLAIQKIIKFCNYLISQEIPHNIMLLYHGIKNLPRIIVWPRKSARGFQPDPSFDNAVAELGGHLPYKVKEIYDNATFESAITHLRECKFETKVYDDLANWIRENL